MMHARFEVYRSSAEKQDPMSNAISMDWRWRLVAANGEIVCSGEAHNSRSDAVRALRTVADLAQDADVVTRDA